ncbi:60S ribosomal protein L7 [Seminavis robusta]|uniref:60S ribosomal protein L7 n=1 Tax=Seminavis robusta TaxID=568900 RepID=A0A9N8F1Z0_9STRA|nr:60S ribosomal protein L7 [Seminavis robusta]|eukprot:Sro2618_g332790.1 60S ribosomal protein L7 (291) ;mRNA; f:9174-10046
MTASNIPKKYKDLPLVPETVLKKRHDLDELRRKKAAAQLEKDQTAPGIKAKKNIPKAKKPTALETLVSQGKSRRNGQKRYSRVLKKGMQTRASNKKTESTKEVELDNDEAEEETVTKTIRYQSNSVGAPMVFVIRVRDHHSASSMVKRILSRLRLRHINEGVFVRYDESHKKMLHLVEPWVIYGPPVKGVVEDLIERRGFGKIDGKRVALSDNTIIENALGDDHGVICSEDLVHEIFEAGDSFFPVTKFLWPFRLSHKTTHFERDTLKFKQGKNFGDQGEEINDIIRQML